MKTRSVADVAKSSNLPSTTTSNELKTEKVRTQANRPSETLEVIESGSKNNKKKKIRSTAARSPIEHDLCVSYTRELQPPLAKVKQTLKK